MTAAPPTEPRGPRRRTPSIPDRDHLQAVLDETERRLDPANPESGGHVRSWPTARSPPR